MEPVSFSIGVAALASLFSTCLQCFEIINLGRNFSRDVEILMAKLESHKLIFSIWGHTVGLDNGGDKFSRLLLDPQIYKGIHSLLTCIHMVFLDADKLTKKYGMKTISASAAGHWHIFRSRVRLRQNETSLMSKMQWAVHDKDKFGTMVTDLKDLIDQLRDLTASVADLERQRKTFIEEVSSVSDVPSLELLEEALKGDDGEASNIASQRILQLTNGSVGEAMSRMTLDSDSAYVTAPSKPACEAEVQDSLPTDAVEDNFWGSKTDWEADDLRTAIEASLMSGQSGANIVDGHQNNLKIIQDADREYFKNGHFGSGKLEEHALRSLIRELRDFLNGEMGFTSIRAMYNAVSEFWTHPTLVLL